MVHQQVVHHLDIARYVPGSPAARELMPTVRPEQIPGSETVSPRPTSAMTGSTLKSYLCIVEHASVDANCVSTRDYLLRILPCHAGFLVREGTTKLERTGAETTEERAQNKEKKLQKMSFCPLSKQTP